MGVIELQRHSRDDQQQETRYHQEVEKPFERHKSGEPFVIGLGVDFGLPECLRIMKVQVNGPEQPKESVGAEKGEGADQQRSHQEEYTVQYRVILPVQGVGVWLELGEAGAG